MDKIDIKSLSRRELEGLIAGLGGERYRAGQIYRWLYARGARSFDDMTDLNASLREKLKAKCRITHVTLLDSRRSPSDGTAKYLFKLGDSNTIETVFIPEKDRNTICLSSQVGCKFGCLFCASAPFGFVRNLKVSEMLDEVLFVKSHHPDSRITNIVFMGIGEPFDNYDNVMDAIRMLNDRDAFDIGARKITVSTCGIIPAMQRFAKEGLQVELSVSLHAADNATRSKLVPVNRKYPLSDLIDACREYVEATNRIITFEYVLIEGMNASEKDARNLARLLKGMKCKVNAIAYNQIKARGYSAPSAKTAALFMKTLKGCGVNAMLRKSRGEDIDAGCGQLRISKL